ncbi:MAG: hypothetical protein RL748_1612 [Pseudomonadota bacterium]
MMTQYSSPTRLETNPQHISLAAFMAQQNPHSCLLVTVDSVSGEWQEVQAMSLTHMLTKYARMQQASGLWQQLGPHHVRRSGLEAGPVNDRMLALEDLMSVHKTLLQDMLKAANEIDDLFQSLAAPRVHADSGHSQS